MGRGGARAPGHGAGRLTGGKTRLHARLPGGEALSSIYDYQHAAALRAGVHFELGFNATAADVRALEPHAVVLATGSRMLAPSWAGELLPDLRSAIDPILQHKARQRGTAVIYDMDHTEGTYAAAELLHALFEQVVILTPRDTVATLASLVTRQGILRRLNEKRIRSLVLVEPSLDRISRTGRSAT